MHKHPKQYSLYYINKTLYTCSYTGFMYIHYMYLLLKYWLGFYTAAIYNPDIFSELL